MRPEQIGLQNAMRAASAAKTKTQMQAQAQTQPFAEILESKLEFSKHARNRIEERNMNVTGEHLEKLDNAVKKAEKHGLTNTLVMMDKMAFIVNVQRNIVITAMKEQDIEGNVFKEIDGAVVL